FNQPDALGVGPTPFYGTLTDDNFASTLNARPGCATAVQNAGGAPIASGTAWAAIFPNNQIPTACFDATANALYQNYVAPSGTGVVTFTPDRHLRDDQFTVRFDHNFSPTQHFSAYYYFDDVNRTDPFSNFQAAGADVPGFGGLFKTRVQQWNIS